jgi:CheY-like chemotaxis protein
VSNLTAKKSAQLFTDYISEKRVLIADSSPASRGGLARSLVDMGAKGSNITLAKNFDSALEEIERIKPQMVICDYDLGNGRGLDLLQHQREQQDASQKTIFVLVTSNTSQSAVAQAAEEDVDTFILKPYTIEVLRNSILKAAIAKLFPTDYIKTIEDGKELLFSGNPDGSIEIFKKAMQMDPAPALACAYLGQAERLKEAIEQAKGSYQEGLGFKKIHYKCLAGLFDLLMSQKQYADAYDVIKKVARYFPANPQRLATVLRLAVMTKSYEDIERYYQIFTSIENRNDELIRYICAALVVCGKFYLLRSSQSRALELFEKAAVTAGGRTKILREVISALMEHGLPKAADKYLKRFPAETHGSDDYLVMHYLVSNDGMEASLAVSKGRILLEKGIEDSVVYKILIARSFEIGHLDSADDLLSKALQKWPTEKRDFFKP